MGKGNDFINVIDVEATCWRGRPPKGQYKEIIEIGIACVDYRTHEIKKKDSIIVKPKSEISEFCTELTSITQELIDEEGISFEEACHILVTKYSSRNRMWVSWGDYDRIQFELDCKFKGVDYPFGRTHFNIKEWFAWKYQMVNSPGVSSALELLGLEFEGVQHRGVDDAFNIARILQTL